MLVSLPKKWCGRELVAHLRFAMCRCVFVAQSIQIVFFNKNTNALLTTNTNSPNQIMDIIRLNILVHIYLPLY